MNDVNYFKQQLKKFLDNEEQCAFEYWIRRTDPHGDCESVHNQWVGSSDYKDFTDQFEPIFMLIEEGVAGE